MSSSARTDSGNSCGGRQHPDVSPPRLPGGQPDLNGIWQALNEANFDLEAHTARPAMGLRAGPYGPLPTPKVLYLSAVGAVPGGMGVVEGGTIPYRPEALGIKAESQANWIDRDPEIKCYLPGVPRATYMPHPFQVLQSDSAFFIAYEYIAAASGSPSSYWVDDYAGSPTIVVFKLP